jgi:hypothetical protein
MKRMLGAGFALALLGFGIPAHAAPLTPAQLAELCKNAEDQAHCGRLVEEVQLKRLPGLAERAGDDLKVTLFPSGHVTFRDSIAISGARSFALWDYLDRINAVVLYATDGDQTSFVLIQRTNGRQYRLPAEPSVSPDRQHLVTADFCADGCDGEVAVWRVSREDVRKELAWKPQPAWTDATATWKDAETISVEFTPAGEDKPRTLVRRLSDAGWLKPDQR